MMSESPVAVSDRNRHHPRVWSPNTTYTSPITSLFLLHPTQTAQLCECAVADISARVFGSETRAVGEDVDVLHFCKLSGCHTFEVGGGDSGHWKGEDLNIGIAESMSVDGHR